MNFEAASLAYIRHVIAETGLSAGGLAKSAGVSASTLTRALNDPNHRFTLSMRTIEKIATFSKINPAPFLEEPSRTLPGRLRDDPRKNRSNWASRRSLREQYRDKPRKRIPR
jgi:lambda repressor-like predicted transcriptional regulator